MLLVKIPEFAEELLPTIGMAFIQRIKDADNFTSIGRLDTVHEDSPQLRKIFCQALAITLVTG